MTSNIQLKRRLQNINPAYSYPLLYMAVIPDKLDDSTTVVAREDEIEKGIDPDDLEAKLEKMGCPEPHKSEAKRGAESIKYISDVIDHLEKKGELKQIDRYIVNSGYTPVPHKKPTEASNKNKEAAAYTDGRNIGVNTRFIEAAEIIAKEANVPLIYAAYFAYFHEHNHKVRQHPQKITNPIDLIFAEANNELESAKYFAKRSLDTTDPEEKEYYGRLAKYADERGKGILIAASGNKNNIQQDIVKMVYSILVSSSLFNNKKQLYKK